MHKLLAVSLLFISHISSAQEDMLVVSYENTANGLDVYVKNIGFCPYTLDITIQAKNLTSDQSYPFYQVVPPSGERQRIASLTIEDKKKGYEFGYEYTYYRGNAIDTQIDHDFVYQLPFKVGAKFLMSQGYGGEFSHEGRNAIDFTMPLNTPVVASRSGIVIDVKEDSNRGCPDESCLQLANFITIYHEDGSFADYTHLTKKGSLVKPGEKVTQGQTIGYSGDTGFSSGAHLHFEVYYYQLSDQITVPTKFRIDRNNLGYLEEGTEYTSFGI